MSIYCLNIISSLFGGVVNILRNKRAKAVIKGLKDRLKKQQGQVDILCRDMVRAHTDFSANLHKMCFLLEFYETVTGMKNVSQILSSACQAYRSIFGDVSVAFYLTSTSSFEYHSKCKDDMVEIGTSQIESCFSKELADSLSSSNMIMRLGDINQLAYQENLGLLKDMNVVVIPLRKLGPEIGFGMIYCDSSIELKDKDIELAASISAGMAKAVAGCVFPARTGCS